MKQRKRNQEECYAVSLSDISISIIYMVHI